MDDPKGDRELLQAIVMRISLLRADRLRLIREMATHFVNRRGFSNQLKECQELDQAIAIGTTLGAHLQQHIQDSSTVDPGAN